MNEGTVKTTRPEERSNAGARLLGRIPWGRIGLPIVLTADDIERLPIEVEDGLYRIAQEALHNVVKHAAARQVRLTLTREPDAVWLRIADDGSGFDPSGTPPGHLGIAGMRARAEKIGATFELSSRRGVGTTIDVRVPVAVRSAVVNDDVVARPSVEPGELAPQMS